MRLSRPVVAAVVLAGGLAVAVPALATNLPVLLYDPPKMLFKDLPDIDSSEDVDASKQGTDFVLVSQPSGMTLDPKSQAGCNPVAQGFACPVTGVKRMIIKLGELNDVVEIDLDSRADNVTQLLYGGTGPDTMVGEDGRQEFIGGRGGDVLDGGAGPDILNGGRGDDVCDGGAGHDQFRRCETAVQ